jgi:hypothetical protein
MRHPPTLGTKKVPQWAEDLLSQAVVRCSVPHHLLFGTLQSLQLTAQLVHAALQLFMVPTAVCRGCRVPIPGCV